jgi:hypothetical protein
MEKENLKNSVWELSFIVSMNQDYYQTLTFYAACLDRLVRIVVGILAVFSLIIACVPDWGSWSITLAIVSLVTALVLNIVPLQNYERKFAQLYQQWTDLRAHLQRFEIRVFGQVLEANFMICSKGRLIEKVLPADARDFQDLTNERHRIEADEFWDCDWLNRKCQRAERQRRWGPQIKTYEQEIAEISRRKEEFKKENSAPAA